MDFRVAANTSEPGSRCSITSESKFKLSKSSKTFPVDRFEFSFWALRQLVNSVGIVGARLFVRSPGSQ